MKIPCRVNGKKALVVGYVAGAKGAVKAIVMTDGVLKAVKLRHIDLDWEKEPKAKPQQKPEPSAEVLQLKPRYEARDEDINDLGESAAAG